MKKFFKTPSQFSLEKVSDEIKIYDKRIGDRGARVQVLASSSKGNASVINKDLHIDFGMMSKDYVNTLRKHNILKNNLKGYIYYNVYNTLLITHKHLDHFNANSIVRCMGYDDLFETMIAPKECNEAVRNEINRYIDGKVTIEEDGQVEAITRTLKKKKSAGEFDNFFINIKHNKEIIVEKKEYTRFGYKIIPLKVDHDGETETYAFDITNTCTGQRILYATDLTDTKDLPSKEDDLFDLIVIENNWHLSMLSGQSYKFTEGHTRHLGGHQSLNYIKKHLKENGHFEEIHTSCNTIELEVLMERENLNKKLEVF